MARKLAEIRFEATQKRRKNIVIAIILFALGISLVVAGTLAYYRSTLSGVTSGTIAAWNFKANNVTTNFTISLTPNNGVSTSSSTIAPGTSGSFSVALSASASALGVDYEINFSDFTNLPQNLIFYTDDNYTTTVDLTNNYSFEGTLAAGALLTKTWYWDWPYGNSSSITTDNASIDKTVSFNVTVVGTQVHP